MGREGDSISKRINPLRRCFRGTILAVREVALGPPVRTPLKLHRRTPS